MLFATFLFGQQLRRYLLLNTEKKWLKWSMFKKDNVPMYSKQDGLLAKFSFTYKESMCLLQRKQRWEMLLTLDKAEA